MVGKLQRLEKRKEMSFMGDARCFIRPTEYYMDMGRRIPGSRGEPSGRHLGEERYSSGQVCLADYWDGTIEI